MRFVMPLTFFRLSMFFPQRPVISKTGIILCDTWPELLSAWQIVDIRRRHFPGDSVHLRFSVFRLSGWGGPIHLSQLTCDVRMTSVRLQVLDGMTTTLACCPWSCIALPSWPAHWCGFLQKINSGSLLSSIFLIVRISKSLLMVVCMAALLWQARHAIKKTDQLSNKKSPVYDQTDRRNTRRKKSATVKEP